MSIKALMITEPGSIIVNEIPMPEAGENEAILKIKYCGICGADVASFTGNQPFTTYPRIPGHEFSAEIVSIPQNDRGLKAGDIVTANPYFNCGQCYSCQRGFVNCCMDNQTMGVQRDGSFCQYIAMPVERIIGGKGLSAKELALIEPFSISYHAVVTRGLVKSGDNVLIVGAGPIGLFALIAAKAAGAIVTVTDVLDKRLELAREFGADETINPTKGEIPKDCYDMCVEACGLSTTFLTCIEAAAFAGKIVLIGNGKKETTFLHSILLKKELNVFGSRNSFTGDFEKLIDIVANEKLDIMKMVTDIYSFEKAQEAFDALVHNDGSLAKVLIEF